MGVFAIAIAVVAVSLAVVLIVRRRKPNTRDTPDTSLVQTPVWTPQAGGEEFWKPASPLPLGSAPIPEDPQIGEQHMRDFTIQNPPAEARQPTHDVILPGPARMPTITMSLNLEKIKGAGEDAQPLLLVGQSGSAWVGVFDGLGGAGKRRYPVKGGEWTGARIGSFTARWAVESWIMRRGQYFTPVETGCVLDEIDTEVERSLKMMDSRFPVSGPVITGSAIRSFPTTVAIGLIEAPGDHKARIRALWAGDSRVYLLSPHQGLVALTTDHVRDNDPDSNRTSDSPMTNLASASVPFYLEETVWEGKFPVVMFAASDGCFEYFDSPMQFEATVLSTLAASASAAEWAQSMASILETVASDDCTMSLVAVGWPTFEALKTSFTRRDAHVRALQAEMDRFTEDIHQEESSIDALLAKIDEHRTEVDRLRTAKHKREDTQWTDYRHDYAIVAEGRKSTRWTPSMVSRS